MTSHQTTTLNEAQQKAVTADLGHILVLAGAGSGKTSVLIRRIEFLIQNQNISARHILPITFTNKAAAEINARLQTLLGGAAQGMWMGTFHSIAHRLLRLHAHDAKLPDTFQIMDSDDQLRLVKRILKDLNIDDPRYPPNKVQWFINHKKDDGLRATHISPTHDPVHNRYLQIYYAYEAACERAGLVDFAELLLRAYELWKNSPALLEHYQQRFQHILVDEFQDTNAIQYAWVSMLVGKKGHLMAVGDDDQSIYGWRGAKIENIQRFTSDFKNSQVIRLEQNYRSTGNILAAANAVIDCNQGRLGKTLWTDRGKGELISLYAAFNDLDEARFIVDKIKDWLAQGHPRGSVALLYRSNAQSRVLEENLMNANIPYRVYGGQRFFDRAEIKDVLAYLRLACNRHDDGAFERVINTPTRGIGNTTLLQLQTDAKEQNLSLWQTTLNSISSQKLSSRAASAVMQFIDLINSMTTTIENLPLHEQVDHVLYHSGLIEHYKKEPGEKGRARVENMEELINAARQFVPEEIDGQTLSTPLSNFIAQAALEAGQTQAEEHVDSVQLMTLHSAKGLEFPLVFLCGVEEGLFPHKMSADDPERLEEERRLCYVGMTRAMKKLFITYAQMRRLHGSETFQGPSRFIKEIPKELLNEIQLENRVSQPSTKSWGFEKSFASKTRAIDKPLAPPEQSLPFKMGARVTHAKFGEGIVMTYEGNDANLCVHVKFKNAGLKRLILQYANLTHA